MKYQTDFTTVDIGFTELISTEYAFSTDSNRFVRLISSMTDTGADDLIQTDVTSTKSSSNYNKVEGIFDFDLDNFAVQSLTSIELPLSLS
jgi:hypothetical protein